MKIWLLVYVMTLYRMNWFLGCLTTLFQLQRLQTYSVEWGGKININGDLKEAAVAWGEEKTKHLSQGSR